MGRAGKRIRWGLGLAMAAVLIGAGVCWAWPRLFADPLQAGLAAYRQGNWQDASLLSRQRLNRDPNDPRALQLFARSSARLERDETAQSSYRRLGAAAMRAEDFFLLASGLLRQRKNELAWGALEMAQRIEPEHPETLHEMARLLTQKDEIEQAISIAGLLASVPGWEARGQVMLALLHKEQDDPDGVAAALKVALGHDPELHGNSTSPASARKLLARALLELERPADARTAFQNKPGTGTDPEVFWLLSRAYLQEGSISEATDAFGRSQGYGISRPLDPEPAPYVGAARCAECHRAIHRMQQHSRHSKTFHRASELGDLALPEHPVADPFDTEVLHTLKREGSGLSVETNARGRRMQALVDFAFGSGDRGLTLVGRDEAGASRELRLSHYNDGSGWDRTTGQPPQPANIDSFLGKPLSPRGVRLCVVCHTTSPRAARDSAWPARDDHGIGCEHCHGPGGNHIKAVEAHFGDLAIARPKLASASQVVALCARCHSPRQGEVSPADKKSVRFQATTLTWSRCYTQSREALSCVTCHNPHRDAETSDSFYEAKCLACHSASSGPAITARSPGTHPVTLPEGVRRVACPVDSTRGCISCHMPTVTGAVPHTPFTDHNIGVHRDIANPRGLSTVPSN